MAVVAWVVLGHTGGLINPCPGVEDVEPAIVIPVDLPKPRERTTP